MLRKLLLPTIFAVLAYGFWISPEFKMIAAGLALFMLGMISLEEGFKAFTGGTLEIILRNTTDKLWKSLSFGIVTTSIMQSSSLVSLITISFLSAGLIELAAGIGVVFGANLGTTTGAWLIAGLGLKVNISAYAMPLLVFGVVLILQRSRVLRGIGYGLTGLGLLFLGIYYMKEGFDAFQNTFNLAEYAVPGIKGLFLFALIGALATFILQSSHATLVLIITALAAHQIAYENALALAVGANVGTTITALLGSMSANVDGKRLAVAHLVFNLVTGLVAIIFIYQFIYSVDWISNHIGIADHDYTLKLALFHTLFNLLGLVMMVPLINTMVVVLQRVVKEPVTALDKPRYLNKAAIEVPAAAIEAVRNELIHLYENAYRLIAHGLSLHRGVIDSDKDLEAAVTQTRRLIPLDIDEYYNLYIKDLYSAIIEYISHVQAQELPEHFADELSALRQASRHIVEAVKGMKHLHKNLSRSVLTRNEYVRQQYNSIRLELATILREIENLKSRGPDTDTLLSLDAVKLSLKGSDRKMNSTLDDLIRKKFITAKLATSLMNDSSYAYDIGQNLVEMAKILLTARHPAEMDLMQKLALDEKDIATLLEEGNEGNKETTSSVAEKYRKIQP
jgi:phosphate:Na+ symporter